MTIKRRVEVAHGRLLDPIPTISPKGGNVKRIFVFLAIAMAFFIAMPIAANPSVALSAFEPLGLAASLAPAFPALDVAPIEAVAHGSLQSAQAFESTIAPSTTASSLALLIIAAAMLAGLMRGALTPSNRLSAYHYDPRDRLEALARDQCSGAFGA